ncbi:hypothetical protein K080096A4_04080 [[Clostridium] innocuum]
MRKSRLSTCCHRYQYADAHLILFLYRRALRSKLKLFYPSKRYVRPLESVNKTKEMPYNTFENGDK